VVTEVYSDCFVKLFLGFVLCLNFEIIKAQHFSSWILLLSSDKKGKEDRNPICWPLLVELA
jgi:hypothetical protein